VVQFLIQRRLGLGIKVVLLLIVRSGF